MVATTTNQPVRAEVRQVADRLLGYLKDHLDTDVDAVMGDLLNDTERAVSETNLAKALKAANVDAPLGAYRGGTGSLKNAALSETEGELAQEAIAALKAAHRLVQCGRGRGKCLVVVSTDPLGGGRGRRVEAIPATEAAPAKAPAAAAKRDDTFLQLGEMWSTMLEAITDLSERVQRIEASQGETAKAMEEVRTQFDESRQAMRDALEHPRHTW